MIVEIARTDLEILKCKSAIQALRPFISDEDYLFQVKSTLADRRQMVYIEDNLIAGAVAVFEVGYNLFRGKYIYIDDLSTIPACRGKGYAGKIVDWILDYARAENISEVHLDSGVSAERTDAHRLYLNKRFQVASLHFTHKIK